MNKKYYSGAQVFDIISKCKDKVFLELLNRFAEESGADVRENVHGKWIEKDGTDWRFSKEYNCSICGKYRLVTNPAGWEWNYCPNCGAEMRGEGNERKDDD